MDHLIRQDNENNPFSITRKVNISNVLNKRYVNEWELDLIHPIAKQNSP
jgi:hypothetical protein